MDSVYAFSTLDCSFSFPFSLFAINFVLRTVSEYLAQWKIDGQSM